MFTIRRDLYRGGDLPVAGHFRTVCYKDKQWGSHREGQQAVRVQSVARRDNGRLRKQVYGRGAGGES